jgi:hypothetical protein
MGREKGLASGWKAGAIPKNPRRSVFLTFLIVIFLKVLITFTAKGLLEY